VEIDAIGAVLHLDVIDAAQEIIRMRVRPVCRIRCVDIRPTACDRDVAIADAQVGQHCSHRRIDTRHQCAEILEPV